MYSGIQKTLNVFMRQAQTLGLLYLTLSGQPVLIAGRQNRQIVMGDRQIRLQRGQLISRVTKAFKIVVIEGQLTQNDLIVTIAVVSLIRAKARAFCSGVPCLFSPG